MNKTIKDMLNYIIWWLELFFALGVPIALVFLIWGLVSTICSKFRKRSMSKFVGDFNPDDTRSHSL